MSHARILIVDDEPNIRKLLGGVLEDEGYTVERAADTGEAAALLAAGSVDLILLDVMLPGTDGLAWLGELGEAGEHPPVIMMSGHGTIRTALEAVKLGALDFIEKPIQAGRLLVSIAGALERQQLRRENRGLREAMGATGEILGSSRAMVELRAAVARGADSQARVLITGENGTGKELVARALHEGSPRRGRPFVKVNCAAIPSELLESELFGHERGAFTGAVARRLGKFERAQGGTLLLDEIGDMNAATQAKLLRVLEENEMERVGGEESIELDVRVLASTNRDIESLMESGGFRRDLYHRIKVIPLHVAPLREHAEDVAELAVHYLGHFCEANGRAPKSLMPGAMERLLSHPWPGNVRELRNLMERLVIMVEGEQIDADRLQLAAEEGGATDLPAGTLAERLEAFERQELGRALAAAGGNVAAAARSLGVDRGNLHRRLTRLGIEA